MRTTLHRLLTAVAAIALTSSVLAAPGASAETTNDTAYPVLNGVTMLATSVAAGSSITAAVDATDDTGVSSVSIRFVNTEISNEVIDVSRTWRADGLVSVPVPSSRATGTYQIGWVTLVDTSGKSATYATLGKTLTLIPTVNTGPFTHDLNLAATTFDVTGGVDRTPPTIKSISMPTRPAIANTKGLLDIVLDDSGPVTVNAAWSNPALVGSQGTGSVVVNSGRASVPFYLGLAGVNSFDTIEVIDAAGNMRTYFRDGRQRTSSGYTPHSLDFPRLDVTLKPAAPLTDAKPHPKSFRVVFGATEDEAKTLTGWRIVVNPGNIVRDVAPKAGVTQVDVGGLVNGTTYTVTMTARSSVGDSPATVRTVRPMPSTNVFAVADATGDGRVDVVARQPFSASSWGESYIYPTNGTGAWRTRTTGFHADESNCQRVAPGDIYIVGQSEVLCYGNALVALNRDGSGSQLHASGWTSMRFVDGGQDLTGDGWPDIMAVTSDGTMRLYQTGSESHIVSSKAISTGWNIYTAVFQVGDFNGDRKNDVMALDTAGRMWLYKGTGKGTLVSRVQVGSGWGGFSAVVPLRDFNGDKKNDVGAIAADGTFYLYAGNGTGGWLPRKVIGTGWHAFL